MRDAGGWRSPAQEARGRGDERIYPANSLTVVAAVAAPNGDYSGTLDDLGLGLVAESRAPWHSR